MEFSHGEALDAVSVVNGVVASQTRDGAEVSVGDIADGVEKASATLSAQEQQKAQQYVVGLQEFHHGTIITTLDPGIGGLYDGSDRMVAANSLMVDHSIQTSIACSQEADDHEMAHAEGKHTEAYEVYADDSGSSQYFVLGGVTFDHEALIEGYTVNATGDAFVSDQYKFFRTQYVTALSHTDVSEEEVQHAINITHDLAAIDDRAREKITHANKPTFSFMDVSPTPGEEF